jgi:hypothetical protein
MPGKKQPIGEAPSAARKLTMEQFRATRERVNRTSVDFLKLDVETALTFTSNALSTDNEEKKQRNRKAARKAYDTVLRLAKKVELTNSEKRFLNRGLQKLKEDLATLGEEV